MHKIKKFAKVIKTIKGTMLSFMEKKLCLFDQIMFILDLGAYTLNRTKLHPKFVVGTEKYFTNERKKINLNLRPKSKDDKRVKRFPTTRRGRHVFLSRGVR